jgi:NADH-quinone oxidoreductase subunit J
VGGIMVLFLFVIMLVNLDLAAKQRQFNSQWWIALLCVAVVGAEVFYFIRKGASAFQFPKAAPPATAVAVGNTEAIADMLFSQYLLPFEIASVLLLVAVVGSVVMAKKRI